MLIVDDDAGTRETFAWAFRSRGVDAQTARCGSEALAATTSTRFDLILLDFRMPDMCGTEVIRQLRDQGRAVPFVLMSAFATVAVTVDAMKLGALDVLDKAMGIDDLVAKVLHQVTTSCAPSPVSEGRGRGGSSSRHERTPSAAERWAGYVASACERDEDFKTIDDLAGFLAISYSSFCESCRIVNVHPQSARDLARMLRVVVRVRADRVHPESVLNVSDRRTLEKLFDQAGLDPSAISSWSTKTFLDRQRFVALDNDGVKALRRVLASGARPPT